MVKIDKESLEKALKNPKAEKTPAPENQPQAPQMAAEEGNLGSSMGKDEEIGFHKGSLNTLAAERNELVKMIGNVEAIMQAHIKRLEELGVKIDTQGQK